MRKPRKKKKTAKQPTNRSIEKRPPKGDTLTGVIRMHARGFGFVIPDDPTKSDQDVFIPKQFTENAVDGDHVEITYKPSRRSNKGPEGEVVTILKRGHSHLAGVIETIDDQAITAYVPILGDNSVVQIINEKKTKLKTGDRYIFEVIEWGHQKSPTICEISKKIGHIDDPSCDTQAAIEEYGLRGIFPEEASKEASEFGDSVSKKDQIGRHDFTKTSCITIDPETAKDFDDALSISKNDKGHYYLNVHIADVAHYVRGGSALDTEALSRCNSTYFPGTCIPMLPQQLSNNLCSLREGVIRLTVSVIMKFDEHGTLLSSDVKRSMIKSKKRFTYGDALKILEGKLKSPYQKDLKEMAELCLLLKKKRSDRGSIDFSLPELIIIVDDQGKPTGVKVEPYHITHQLVEEFMLKANEVVATHIDKSGKEQLYRTHEEPETENLEAFFAMARTLGFHVPPKPTQQDIQKLFDQARDSRFSQQLAIGFIRNLKIAAYSPSNVGHYGLALEHYCHFTSPIRRYSDLVTQRLLFNEEREDLNLEKTGKMCSEKERISFRAEMGVKKLKKLRLMKSWMEEDPLKTYEAHITKVKPFAISFEVKALNIEGSLHVSELENDYFVYDEISSTLVGKRTGFKYAVGRELFVRPTLIDLIHLEAKWELSEELKPKKMKK